MSSEFHKRQATGILKALLDGHQGYSALELLQICLYLKASAARKPEYQTASTEAVKFIASHRHPERFQFEWASLAGDATEAARYLSRLPAAEIDRLFEDDDALDNATPWKTLKLEDLFVFSEEGDGSSATNTVVAAKSVSTFIVFSGLFCGFNDKDLNKWIGVANLDRIREQHLNMVNQLWPAGTTAIGITEAFQIRLFQMGFNTIRAIGGHIPNGAPFALLREPKVTLMLLGPSFWRTFRQSGLTPALAGAYGINHAERACLDQISPAVPETRAAAAATASAGVWASLKARFSELGLDAILDRQLKAQADPLALAACAGPSDRVPIGRFWVPTPAVRTVVDVDAEVRDHLLVRLFAEDELLKQGPIVPADKAGFIIIPILFRERELAMLILDSMFRTGVKLGAAEVKVVDGFVRFFKDKMTETKWKKKGWAEVEHQIENLKRTG